MDFFLLPVTPADRLDQQIQGQVGSRHALITVAEQPNILPFLQTNRTNPNIGVKILQRL